MSPSLIRHVAVLFAVVILATTVPLTKTILLKTWCMYYKHLQLQTQWKKKITQAFSKKTPEILSLPRKMLVMQQSIQFKWVRNMQNTKTSKENIIVRIE